MELVFICFSLVCTLLGAYYVNEKNKNKKLNKIIERTNELNLSKQGGTILYERSNGEFINYFLRSWDGGKVWYACEYGNNWELEILGKADAIYPGLINHLKNIDNLTDYAKNHGPIDLNTNSEKETSLLENAGFAIAKKSN